MSFELARRTEAVQAEKALTKPAVHRLPQRSSLAKAHDNTFKTKISRVNIMLLSAVTIPRGPQMSQSIPWKPVSPALPQLSSLGSTHNTVARGTALWESLVGKPRGKDSWESRR